MSNKPNGFISTLKFKCPKCRKGDLFLNKNPYQFKNFFSMNRNCKVCGTDLEPEPNFYEGSMYVGYGFSVAIVVTTFVAFNILFDDPNVTWMIIIAIGSAVFFGPLSIKLSRSIWATMLMKYDPNIVKKKE